MSKLCIVQDCGISVLEGEDLCTFHFAQIHSKKSQQVPVEPCPTVKKMMVDPNQTLFRQNKKAPDFLRAALKHMEDRASTYDAPQGERSMAKTVSMFNTLTGHNLTETEGWHFMSLLKMVRSCQGDFKADNYEDGSAYFGLAGESAAKENTK